jgi:hypothetical protein
MDMNEARNLLSPFWEFGVVPFEKGVFQVIREEDLDAIEVVWNEATCGLWAYDPQSGTVCQAEPGGGDVARAVDDYPRGDNNPQESLLLIAVLRNAILPLINEVRRARSERPVS